MVAYIALGHGSALGEGHIRGLASPVRGKLHGEVDHADLRTVPVSNDYLIALFDEVDDGLRGVLHQLKLLLGGIAESVSPESDDYSFRHITSESHT